MTPEKQARADSIKKKFRERGITLTQWAKENQFRPNAVSRVLNGFDKAHYGIAHDIAVKLGLKQSPDQSL
ncbi:DNA-binding protein [Sapientia aquatica]|uniref:DNA-binding protein n=1 Tax=Sapientia aquatica TaxID=1549640 RepID=A0A4V3AUR6_9BURK|nr:DNA-binding protein [Sapientia aquatica]TDK66000.1 DNA-binding protein [Sapientia aquatica]